MFPLLSHFYGTNLGLGDSKKSGNPLLRPSLGSKIRNTSHHALCHFMGVMSFATTVFRRCFGHQFFRNATTNHPMKVELIPRRRYPLQILNSVILLVSILVVTLLAFGFATKGRQNQPVHFFVFEKPIIGEANSEVPVSPQMRLKNPAPIVIALYSPKTTRAVTGPSRYCFPNLFGVNCVRHVQPFYSRLHCLGVPSGINHRDAASFSQRKESV